MPGQLHDPLRFDMLFMFGLSAAIYFNRARARLGDFLELSSRLIITFFDARCMLHRTVLDLARAAIHERQRGAYQRAKNDDAAYCD